MQQGGAAGPAAGGQQQQQQQGGFSFLNLLSNLLLGYMVYSFFKGSSAPPPQVAPDGTMTGGGTAVGNLFPPGALMTLSVFVSEEDTLVEEDYAALSLNKATSTGLLWREVGLTYDWADTNTRALNVTLLPSSHLRNNGSLYAHVLLTRDGYDENPFSPSFDPTKSVAVIHRLNKYLPPPKVDNTFNLLEGKGHGLGNEVVLSSPASDERDLDQWARGGGGKGEEEEKKKMKEEEEEEERRRRRAREAKEEEEEEEAEARAAALLFGETRDGRSDGSEGSGGGVSEYYASSDSSALITPGGTPTKKGPKYVSMWAPSLTINPVTDFTRYANRAAIQSPIVDGMRFEKTTGNYYPVVFINEFWLRSEYLIPINESTSALPLELTLYPLSLLKWQLYTSMQQSLDSQTAMGSSEKDNDEFKRMLLETNPYLLALTAIVSMLHMVFDTLAFKNDIQFWNNNKSMEGLSKRTIFMNIICQTIILLYLIDNETSWMILMSSGVGVAIEVWKVKKAVNVIKDSTARFGWRLEDKDSYSKSGTKKFDDMAYEYMSYVLYPLVVGFSLYSLVHQTHKSWYSWVINTLVGAVYTFGFILMSPQIFINYRLKSVAALPWRAFTYKFLNTIVDDLFAFIIKMPIAHRLACFRDDIIFVIYLYQRWKYPVDPKRRNEYGQTALEQLVTTAAPSLTTQDGDETSSSPVPPLSSVSAAGGGGGASKKGN